MLYISFTIWLFLRYRNYGSRCCKQQFGLTSESWWGQAWIPRKEFVLGWEPDWKKTVIRRIAVRKTSVSDGGPIYITPENPAHHSTLVLRGLRRALNSTTMMPRVASLVAAVYPDQANICVSPQIQRKQFSCRQFSTESKWNGNLFASADLPPQQGNIFTATQRKK